MILNLSKGDWEPLGEGKDDEPVVELPCSTSTIPCVYRKSFIEQWFCQKAICPNCNNIFDYGTQPTGTMDIFSNDPQWLEIKVEFPDNKNYTGTKRHLYYPMNAQGTEAILLIKLAFKRGILFKIGESITTGIKNTTVFGGIHLKTSKTGGPTCHGYPDDGNPHTTPAQPGWFERLKSECLGTWYNFTLNIIISL